ncbi:DUF2779 domain-containing protein [Candidatus Woesearchaeota archaeon]|nr:DUF2779 domain-containing protein [Candidatus Woesearchaeota archaeon]
MGKLAQKLFPDGVNAQIHKDFQGSIIKTKELVNQGKTFFEGSFQYTNAFVRVDIFVPNPDCFELIEVKSSTAAKSIDISDVAFQKYVIQKSGTRVDKAYLMLINNEFVRNGDLDYSQLFTKVDVTEEADEIIRDFEVFLQEINEAICSQNPPNMPIGTHCDDPNACPLKPLCWANVPDDSVFTLYRGKKLAEELQTAGIHTIGEIPPTTRLGAKQEIQYNCARNDNIHIDAQSIQRFLERIRYPIYHMDFETYSLAVPPYDGLKPYQRIPFQFSVHVEHENGEIEHKEFLAPSEETDTRRAFIENLKESIGEQGSVLAYYQSFELGVLRELAEAFPEHQEWVAHISSRVIDLYEPFGSFYYYDTKQKGSASIKNVLPAMTDLSYQGMTISKGDEASAAYYYTVHGFWDGTRMSVEEIQTKRAGLLEYCKLDTWAMVKLLEKLKSHINN